MTHNENTYESPDEFNPDRFKPQSEGGAGEPLPIGQFGFGRRLEHLCLFSSFFGTKLTQKQNMSWSSLGGSKCLDRDGHHACDA